MKNKHAVNCPPDCPHRMDEEGPYFPDQNCQCGKPMMIYLRPGEHFHPCPVHPDYVIKGGPDVRGEI